MSRAAARRERRHGPPDAQGLGDPLQRARRRWTLRPLERRAAADADGDEQAELLRHRDGRSRSGEGRLLRFHARGSGGIAEKKFGKSMHPTSMGRLLRRLGLSRQKARPSHPMKDPAAAAAFKKSPADPAKIQRTHKNKRLRLYFQDEARIGQKGRVCHVWWKRGERPPGLLDQRFTFALYGAFFVKGPRARAYPIISTSVSLFDLEAVSSPRPIIPVTVARRGCQGWRFQRRRRLVLYWPEHDGTLERSG